MKKTLQNTLLLLTLFAFASCGETISTFSSGSTPATAATPVPVRTDASDPIVVNAEKTLLIARDTFTLYVHLERDNHATLARVSPKFYEFGQTLRRNGLKWLRTADDLKEAYKHNRSNENKANLLTALATVSEALTQAQQYIHDSRLNSP